MPEEEKFPLAKRRCEDCGRRIHPKRIARGERKCGSCELGGVSYDPQLKIQATCPSCGETSAFPPPVPGVTFMDHQRRCVLEGLAKAREHAADHVCLFCRTKFPALSEDVIWHWRRAIICRTCRGIKELRPRCKECGGTGQVMKEDYSAAYKEKLLDRGVHW